MHVSSHKLKTDCSEIRQTRNLTQLFQAAINFDRSNLLRELAVVTASIIPTLASVELDGLLSFVDAKGLRMLVSNSYYLHDKVIDGSACCQMKEVLAFRKVEHASIRKDVYAMQEAVAQQYGWTATLKCTKLTEAKGRVDKALQ